MYPVTLFSGVLRGSLVSTRGLWLCAIRQLAILWRCSDLGLSEKLSTTVFVNEKSSIPGSMSPRQLRRWLWAARLRCGASLSFVQSVSVEEIIAMGAEETETMEVAKDSEKDAIVEEEDATPKGKKDCVRSSVTRRQPNVPHLG